MSKVQFSWTPSPGMFVFLLFLVLFLWKIEMNYLYYNAKWIGNWRILIFFVSPFILLFLVWNAFEQLFKLIYGKHKI